MIDRRKKKTQTAGVSKDLKDFQIAVSERTRHPAYASKEGESEVNGQRGTTTTTYCNALREATIHTVRLLPSSQSVV